MNNECEICGAFLPKKVHGNRKYCEDCSKNPDKARRIIAKGIMINKRNAGHWDKVKEFTCRVCGKKYLNYHARGGFCSDVCLEKHMEENRKCRFCLKFLKESNYDSKIYCSAECKQQDKLERAKEKGNYIACEYCGEMFIKKRYSQWFCSVECSRNSKREQKEKQKAKPPAIGQNVKREEDRLCEWCKKPFAWKIENARKRFCSVECRKEKAKSLKTKPTTPDTPICITCRRPQRECAWFESKFVYMPKGAKSKVVNGNNVVISCPLYKE